MATSGEFVDDGVKMTGSLEANYLHVATPQSKFQEVSLKGHLYGQRLMSPANSREKKARDN